MVKKRGHRDRKKQYITQCEEMKNELIIVYIIYTIKSTEYDRKQNNFYKIKWQYFYGQIKK